MSKCVKCGEVVPTQVPEAMFCVHCGRPVGQKCPYCGNQYVALLQDDGRVEKGCRSCGQFFKFCRACGRLHRITHDRCATPGCGQPLYESSTAFPFTFGPLNGTRTCVIQGPVIGDLHLCRHADSDYFELPNILLEQSVYRYGRLYSFSSEAMHCLIWNGHGWEPHGRPVPFGATALGRVRSVLLEDQIASLTCQAAFQLINVGDDVCNFDPEPGESRPHRQAAGAHRLVWLYKSGRLQWRLTHQLTQTHDFKLPFSGHEVNDLVADTQIYLAAQTGLWRLDPVDNTLARLDDENEAISWQRMAVIDGTVVAMGHTRNHVGTVLRQYTGDDQPLSFPLREICHDFCWTGAQLFLITENTVIPFSTQSWTPTADPIQTSATAHSISGAICLQGTDTARLVLRRRADATMVYELFHAPTATCRQIGMPVNAHPHFVLAEDRLVLVYPEHTAPDTRRTRIRTFRTEGSL